MKLQIGGIVRTNYETGPYRITDCFGPCRCPHPVAQINFENPPASEPHYHLTCTSALERSGSARHDTESYLAGYRLDGTSVWSSDYLIFEGMARGVTLDLFAMERSAA